MLLISALQPALLLVLFRYVLGGAIHIPGRSYVDYVVPAVFGGGPAAQYVWQSLAWSAGITAVFFAIALHLYRRSVQ